ncbi:hypothetical protein D9613_003186 [Agrocybe pediades]|uniref:CxC5 like cysteine cluster associated with KDZ domain-containing protein n=1 Tax=Agrocybe pediades TaxID=84607 RepID=A0A8H4QNW4_9AGAR|nr:hypothetical protein D9613_003186 [Agrocybe pediades]
MQLQHLLAPVAEHPSLRALELETILCFIQYALLARPTIRFYSVDARTPPALPSLAVQLVLAQCTGVSVETTKALWDVFKDLVWAAKEDNIPSTDAVYTFNKYALPLGISYYHLYPPVRACQNVSCGNYRATDDIRTLGEPATYKASLFTLRSGALPVYSTSLYCSKCNRRYHHNYFVHAKSDVQEYYAGVPNVIQASKHHFLDSALLEFITTSKVFGWLSAQNCARIYNMSLSSPLSAQLNNELAFGPVKMPDVPEQRHWQTSLELQDEHVLNGFFIYSLLLEKAERGQILSLGHKLNHRDRLQPALQERNQSMEGPGQEAYTHACDLCYVVYEGGDGRKMKIQAAVCDGITIGHPCCAVHDCKAPLATHRARFCDNHLRQYGSKCAVRECSDEKEKGFRTCPAHRSLEAAYFSKNTSVSQLRKRLQRARSHYGFSHGEESDEDEGEEVIVEAILPNTGPDCDGKSSEGNKKVKAYFGRRRTHNEQIIMRPCGVILSRATFFGSEAVSGVHKFMKATFPTPQSVPQLIAFDNGCQLHQHQDAIGDPHFKDTAVVVDVFHFKSKHKETDKYCAIHCNPAAFDEMMDGDKWRFNTSACEQCNSWLSGYQAVLRDMEMTRFNFYLDEMIKRRNRYTIQQLEGKGYKPWEVPAAALFPTDYGFRKEPELAEQDPVLYHEILRLRPLRWSMGLALLSRMSDFVAQLALPAD